MKLEQQVVNLELSKKLKKLGVPQKSIWSWLKHKDEKYGLGMSEYKSGDICTFTLAELIEECLKKDTNFRLHCYSHGFVIEANSQLEDMRICDSPEEAVTNLLAELYK